MEIDKIINQHIIHLWSYKVSYFNFYQKKYTVIKASIYKSVLLKFEARERGYEKENLKITKEISLI